MKRRDFLKTLAAAGAAYAAQAIPGGRRQVGTVFAGPSKATHNGLERLFPTDLPGDQSPTLHSRSYGDGAWAEFPAAGFSRPACGVIYRLARPATNGMPLGGIDTGCIDLETSGLWGYCTLFNSHVPRRGPLNLPFLGVSVGNRTWVLCDPTQIKKGEGSWQEPVEPVLTQLHLEGVHTAREIHYWGHYPVADLEYELDAPIGVGLRAWTPFLPGDTEGSMVPGIVFEVHLRNPGSDALRGTVAFSFPGPTPREADSNRFRLNNARSRFNGVVVAAPKANYALGVIGPEGPNAIRRGESIRPVRLGGELGADGTAWARIAESLPDAAEDQPGASAAVDFALEPGETKVVRFVLAWHSPQWSGSGYPWSDQYPWQGAGYRGAASAKEGNTFTHMYAAPYKSALEVAQLLAREHQPLLGRVLAWQEAIYSDDSLPGWLQDSLINMLHLISEDSLWAQAGPPLPDWVRPEDGLFALNESPRGCPQMECIPNTFYDSVPLVYLFPELILSTLRGQAGYQDAEGAPPWIFGGCTGGTPPIDLARPTRGYQVTLNIPCYVDAVDRYWLAGGDEAFLREFYPSVKKATIFMADLNRGPDGIISMPDRKVSVGPTAWETEWFEWYEWYGMVPHVGGIHLATLRMAQRMAAAVGDEEFARRCREWIEAGQNSMETKMWNGTYYLNCWDPETGKKSDVIFGYQLDGEWMARFHGLAGVFRPDRVRVTLDTIRRLNVPPTRYGALNYVRPDGSVLNPGDPPMKGPYAPYDFFSPEVFMLGMTYMYAGERDFGLELCRRCMENIVCEQRITWDSPNIIRGDTGERTYGNDYPQNLMLWALPAAMAGQDLAGPCKPGGLVDRVVRAAKASG